MADRAIQELTEDFGVWQRTPTARIGIVTAFPEGGTVQTYWMNRGRTAAGVTVYWPSPVSVDTAGVYYTAPVPPWGDIVEVVGVRTWQG